MVASLYKFLAFGNTPCMTIKSNLTLSVFGVYYVQDFMH
jgi:hypothetical protein